VGAHACWLKLGDPLAKPYVSRVSSRFALGVEAAVNVRGYDLLNLRALASGGVRSWHYLYPHEDRRSPPFEGVDKIRQLLLARVDYRNGASLLFGEIQARPPSVRTENPPTFSILCVDLRGLDDDAVARTARQIAQHVADHEGWPTWNAQARQYELENRRLDGRKMQHTVAMHKCKDYGDRDASRGTASLAARHGPASESHLRRCASNQ